jgi:hypothetical protein
VIAVDLQGHAGTEAQKETVTRADDENYLTALKGAHPLTYRLIEAADHAQSEEAWRQSYTSLLVIGATEMVLGAREEWQPRRCATRYIRHT